MPVSIRFPSYPSNHCSAGNGAAEVMRRIYGDDGVLITLTNPAVPTIVLQYSSFKQITDDIPRKSIRCEPRNSSLP